MLLTNIEITEINHGSGNWEYNSSKGYRLNNKLYPFDVNDAWYLPSPLVRKALKSYQKLLRTSPSPYVNDLLDYFSTIYHLNRSSITVNAGSTPVLYELIRKIRCKVNTAITIAPSYQEYEKVLKLNKFIVHKWILSENNNFILDLDKFSIECKKYPNSLIIFANPNNPTGQFIKNEALLNFIKNSTDSFIVIDETYIDFTRNSGISSYINSLDNVAVLRSFSKAYGLAGLRIGYGIVGKKWDFIKPFDNQPWSINSMALQVFIDAYKDYNYVQKKVSQTIMLKNQLISNLSKMPNMKVFPTDTHFFLVKLLNETVNKNFFIKKLLDYNILVKDCSYYGHPLDNVFIRVTTRSKYENQIIIDSFKKIQNLA